jgi:hypothetical protein
VRFGSFFVCGVCEERPSVEHPYEVGGEVIVLHICERCVEELDELIAQCDEVQRWMDDVL